MLELGGFTEVSFLMARAVFNSLSMQAMHAGIARIEEWLGNYLTLMKLVVEAVRPA